MASRTGVRSAGAAMRASLRAMSKGERVAALGLAALFVAVNADVVLQEGVRLAPDSGRYTSGGEALADGEGLSSRQAIYAGYIALLAVGEWTGIGESGVVALQVLLCALAALALFDLGRALAGTRAGLLAALLFVVIPDLTRITGWQAYILPDASYAAMLAISLWAIHRAGERGGRWMATGVVVVLFTASLRPQGWLLVPLAVGYWVLPRVAGRGRRAGMAAAIAAVFVLAVVLAPGFSSNSEEASPVESLTSGQVIYDSEDWRLTMPAGDGGPQDEGWGTALAYAANHPVAVSKLALARAGTELVHARPFYSSSRNAVLLAFVLLLYALAAVGLWRRGGAVAWLCVAIVATHMALVAAFFADYDGRFLVHVLPAVALLAGLGGATLLRRPA